MTDEKTKVEPEKNLDAMQELADNQENSKTEATDAELLVEANRTIEALMDEIATLRLELELLTSSKGESYSEKVARNSKK